MTKLKSYTITCHHVYNYGASLQAFGLQHFLLKRGIENKIINYMPDYLAWHYKFSWWISKRSKHYNILKKNFIIRLIYVVLRYLRDLRSLSRKKSFDRFRNQFLRITRVCKTIDDINSQIDDANLLIAGSDQIWNSFSLENGLDRAFYLDFGPDNVTKVSYAASFGVNELREKDVDFVRDMLSKFNRISVREKKGVILLNTLGFEAALVLDPVFLLNREEWDSFCNRKVSKSNYILIYAIGGITDAMRSMAEKIQKNTNNIILCIRSNKKINGFEEISDAGPDDFIGYIKNASYIISNSFHATAFSLIFRKEFYSFPYATKSSERIENLLNSMNLGERYNTKDFNKNAIIDYATIHFKLEKMKEESIGWIDDIINNLGEK